MKKLIILIAFMFSGAYCMDPALGYMQNYFEEGTTDTPDTDTENWSLSDYLLSDEEPEERCAKITPQKSPLNIPFLELSPSLENLARKAKKLFMENAEAIQRDPDTAELAIAELLMQIKYEFTRSTRKSPLTDSLTD